MAVPALEALHDAGNEIVLVVSNADRRRARRGDLEPTPVKARALQLGLEVTHDLDDILDVDADLGVVVAYGRLIKPAHLEHLPMVNLHFSLLPRWRGAAPVQRALLAGDRFTGVTVMAVEEGLDTGGVYASEKLEIGPTETLVELNDRLVAAGSELLVRTLSAPLGAPEPQSKEDVAYAEKIRPEDLHLDWGRPAVELHRVVRVGGAWSTFRERRLKILAAEVIPGVDLAPGSLRGDVVGCGAGALRLSRVQPEGKPPMDARDWINGARPRAGEILGA